MEIEEFSRNNKKKNDSNETISNNNTQNLENETANETVDSNTTAETAEKKVLFLAILAKTEYFFGKAKEKSDSALFPFENRSQARGFAGAFLGSDGEKPQKALGVRQARRVSAQELRS